MPVTGHMLSQVTGEILTSGQNRGWVTKWSRFGHEREFDRMQACGFTETRKAKSP